MKEFEEYLFLQVFFFKVHWLVHNFWNLPLILKRVYVEHNFHNRFRICLDWMCWSNHFNRFCFQGWVAFSFMLEHERDRIGDRMEEARGHLTIPYFRSFLCMRALLGHNFRDHWNIYLGYMYQSNRYHHFCFQELMVFLLDRV
jgi:hypothetical protein